MIIHVDWKTMILIAKYLLLQRHKMRETKVPSAVK